MSDGIPFVEAQAYPVCPHCERPIEAIEWCKQRLSFGTFGGSTWVIVLTCPSCHKVLGTQGWD